MQPTARTLNLKFFSASLTGIVLLVAISIFIGPWLIDGYVNWLWLNELGYKSVFTTILCTRFVTFFVSGLLVSLIVFFGFLLAYIARSVFIYTDSFNDPIARYRNFIYNKLFAFGIGIPLFIGILTGIVTQSYWVRVQLFLHGNDFGISDPQFGRDLGFYEFTLPFYRLVLVYLFIAIFLALVANILGHYIFGNIKLSERNSIFNHAARTQTICFTGFLILLKTFAYWIDRYELLDNITHDSKPFTGAGYTDINAVLPAKLILMTVALMCAVAVFSAIFLRDLRIPTVGILMLLLSSLVIGNGWPLLVEQFNVKPNAAQKEAEYISRSITATRQAYGLTDQTVTYRNYDNSQVNSRNLTDDHATISNIRLLDPRIISPAFTQFQQGKNFYYFPDQLAIDRYKNNDGIIRDFIVAARELNLDHLIDNQQDWINRHTVYTHGNGFIASPANAVNNLSNNSNQQDGYPRFLSSVVGPSGNIISPGPAQLEQPRIYFGPVIANTAADYAIVGGNGDIDHEYDYENNAQTKNYTYKGVGGVSIGNWFNRFIFAIKYAERNLILSNIIKKDSKIIFNRDPAERVEAAAPWLTTDDNIYPAIVDKRIVWIVDGYTTLEKYPYSELTSDKHVSYIRNSVKATVDAYDGTVILFVQDEQDPVLKTWMSIFPETVRPKSEISKELQDHLRYPEDLFKVQRSLLAKYHVDNPVKFFTNADFWGVPLDPNPISSNFQAPYYITAKDITSSSNSSSFQLVSVMNWIRRDFLAAYISVSSDPSNYGKISVLTVPGQMNGPKLAFNAISTDTTVSQDIGLIGRDSQNHIKWGNLITLPIANGGLLYVVPVYASPGANDNNSSYPRLIRIAMLYGDKVGYAPNVSGALASLFDSSTNTATVNFTNLEDNFSYKYTIDSLNFSMIKQPRIPLVKSNETVPKTKFIGLKEIELAILDMQNEQHNGTFSKYGESLQRLHDTINNFIASN